MTAEDVAETELALPEPGSRADDYAVIVEALPAWPTDALLAALGEVRRRLSTPDTKPDEHEALAGVRHAAQAALAERSIGQRRAETAEAEEAQPLRRRILEFLARADATPTAIREATDARAETVSRIMTTLAGEGLVTRRPDEHDARARIYSLSPEGYFALGRHYALGAPASPKQPDVEATARFLAEALELAIASRRTGRDLDEPAARLRVIVREAEKYALGPLALRARGELATTLRQARARDELHVQLAELAEIATGNRPEFGTDAVLPANGHLEYELGRLGEADRGSAARGRAEHLLAASSIFGRLAEASGARDPRQRQGWAFASLADNLRERTELDQALVFAQRAWQIFRDLEEPYGQARCLFLRGFCHRLQGRFDTAWEELTNSEEIAREQGYERFQIDAHVQMGEVKRCLQEPDAALDYLAEAEARAQALGMHITRAFADTALGATEFACGRHDVAVEWFNRAHSVFAEYSHAAGLALNRRRQAVVVRMAAADHKQTWAAVDAVLDDAMDRYAEMRSPAGYAACVIERGRASIARNEDTSEMCDTLLAIVARDEYRTMLELDPWVPRLLLDFADATDHLRLRKSACELLSSAARRAVHSPDGEWALLVGAGGVGAATAQLGVGASGGSANCEPDGPADEMAGEPRRIDVWSAPAVS